MEILNFQDKKWIVKHKVPDTGITPEKLEWYKWYRGADIVLKKDGILFFAEEIPEINFEEI